MPDIGYRSIEVSVVNLTQAALVVQSVDTSGDSPGWIAGQQPLIGSMLFQYQSAAWGVMTEATDGSVIATVALSGWGTTPVILQMQNLANGQSQVCITGNDKISGSATRIDTGQANHAEWQVFLTPGTPAVTGTTGGGST